MRLRSCEAGWMYPVGLSETPLETAYGREIKGNSSGGHSCIQHANCKLPQNLRHLIPTEIAFGLVLYCVSCQCLLLLGHLL